MDCSAARPSRVKANWTLTTHLETIRLGTFLLSESINILKAVTVTRERNIDALSYILFALLLHNIIFLFNLLR